MKRENLHQPFEICFSELDESQLKEHDHTFFELVYILSGTGIQWINNNKFPYHDGHLFMITPGDIHSFDPILLSMGKPMISLVSLAAKPARRSWRTAYTVLMQSSP